MSGLEAAAQLIEPATTACCKIGGNWLLRNYRYVKHIEKNWEKLQVVEKDLNGKLVDLEGLTKSSLEEETEGCKRWQRRVRRIIVEIQKLQNDYRNKPPTCFCGLCPFRRLRKIGRSIVKKTDEATALCNDRSTLTIMQDKPKSTPRASKWNVVETVMHKSLKTNVAKLLRLVKDKRFKRIGIWGPPGVGKTTTMKIVHEQITGFDKIFYVTAENIQEQICCSLSITNPTDIPGELRGKSYLLFLDDVPSKVDVKELLREVGIDFYNREGKLVFACRDKLDCETDEDMLVKELSKEDATELFWNAVGSEKRGGDFQRIADQMIEWCGGMPPLLNLIAKNVRNKDKIALWRDMASFLKTPNTNNWREWEEYYWSFKHVYDHLDNRSDEQHCLLYWSIFPFDEEINRDYAIDCWAAEQFLKRGKLGEARDRGHRILYSFTEKSLVGKGEEWGHYKMFVSFQHAALRIANEENIKHFFAEYGEGMEKLEWEKAKRVSLGRTLLPRPPQKPQCPGMLTLAIQEKSLTEFPDNFFKRMGDLQVLCLRQTGIVALPPSISKLKNLKGLILNCSQLVQLPAGIGALKNLEILVLHHTGLYSLPREIGKLGNLKCLRISFKEAANQNQVTAGSSSHVNSSNIITNGTQEALISSKIIGKLSKLEELTLDVSGNITAWNINADGIAGEIATLERLTHLHFYFSKMKSFQDFIENSKSWKRNGEDFTSFNFFVGEQGNNPASDFNVLDCSAEKHFKFSGGDSFPDAVSKVLKRATSFELIGHTTACSLTDDLLTDAKELEVFTVEECKKMESIVIVGANSTASPASASGHPLVFKYLKELHIGKLPELESIWQGEIASESFRALTTLTLKECRGITRLFSLNMVSQLPKLQNLHVEDCKSIENIIQAENSDEEVAFGSLKEFQLSKLSSLSSICEARLKLPALEKILIRTCEKLTSLPQILEYASEFSEIRCDQDWWSRQDWSEEVFEEHFRSRRRDL